MRNILLSPQMKADLFDKLLDGIHEPDEVIRGRTADALEKITRFKPELLLGFIKSQIRSICENF